MHELVQQELNRRYLTAAMAWTMNPTVQEAARAFGVSHREYCDLYVRSQFPPLTWTSGTNDHWQPDNDVAYRWRPPVVIEVAGADGVREGEE
jgi:hypothetical protein